MTPKVSPTYSFAADDDSFVHDALLEAIPEVDAPAFEVRDVQPLQNAQTPKAPATPEMKALLQAVRGQMETVFHAEMRRVEDTFAGHAELWSRRVQKANQEIENLREAQRQLHEVKAEYERKLKAIQALTGVVDRQG